MEFILCGEVSSLPDTFLFFVEMRRSGFKCSLMLYSISDRGLKYNDVETTQDLDKGQQYQFKTAWSECERYQYLKIQGSLSTPQGKIRPRRENQCFYPQNFDQ